MESVAQDFLRPFPYQFQELHRGMAETSGLSSDQLALVNAIEVLAASSLDQWHCSALAVWHQYTTGALVYGRNYDYLSRFREINPALCMAVFHPADGSLASAIFGYAGETYCVTGINENGLFIELNNAMPSGGDTWLNDRVPSVAALFQMLLESPSLSAFDADIRSRHSNFAYIIGAADPSGAHCYEWSPKGMFLRPNDDDGMMTMTNHYVDPRWNIALPEDARFWRTCSRRCNLQECAGNYCGLFDAAMMRRVLDLNIAQGGATTDLTIYQTVIVPATLEFWINVPGLQGWTQVDIKSIFHPGKNLRQKFSL